MTMGSYKGFTAEQRYANLRMVKSLIASGKLPNPNTLKCEICGSDIGLREYHCEDYTPEKALDNLHCYCWRCHRNYHILKKGKTHKMYRLATAYFRCLAEGYVFEPVYKNLQDKEFFDEMRMPSIKCVSTDCEISDNLYKLLVEIKNNGN